METWSICLSLTALVLIIGMMIGWRLREIHASRVIFKMLEETMHEEIDQKENVIDVNIEQHDDNLFVYRKLDGAYMAHGKDKTTLENILHEKFPEKLFNASEEDLRKLKR